MRILMYAKGVNLDMSFTCCICRSCGNEYTWQRFFDEVDEESPTCCRNAQTNLMRFLEGKELLSEDQLAYYS